MAETGSSDADAQRKIAPRRRRKLSVVFLAAAAAAVVSACTASSVLTPRPDVDVGTTTAAISGGGLQNLVPSNPYMTTAAYPRVTLPEAQADVMPADEVACRRELRRLGVSYRDLASINDGGACRIDYPV